MEAIAKQIRERPLRSIAIAALAGAWLGYEPPRRGILLGLMRLIVMSELRAFVDRMPARNVGVRPPARAAPVTFPS